MRNKNTPAAWRHAQEEYEKIHDKCSNPHHLKNNYLEHGYCCHEIEWRCLLSLLLCLDPSMEEYELCYAPLFIQALLHEQHFDSLYCLAEYLVVHEDDNMVSQKTGLEILRACSEAGHALSQHLLAIFLFDGIGTEKNPTEALSLLTRAAEAGFSGAYLALAYRYLIGEDIPKDVARAVYYAKKAERMMGNMDSFWDLLQKDEKQR